MKGYWIAKREEPKAIMWVFQKAKLPGEPKEEIILVDGDFPAKIVCGDHRYSLIRTREDKLRLEKANTPGT